MYYSYYGSIYKHFFFICLVLLYDVISEVAKTHHAASYTAILACLFAYLIHIDVIITRS